MPDKPKFKLSRRQAVQLLTTSAGAYFLAACTSAVNEESTSTIEPYQTNSPPPAASPTVPAVDIQGQPALPPGFEAGRLTPIEDFYVQSYEGVAKVDQFTWEFSLVGQVDTSLKLSLLDIQRRPAIEQMHTLECIGNPVGGNLIGNTVWRGISFRDLLLEAGLKPEAAYLHFYCADEYFTSVPLELGLDEKSLLVYEMNDENLPEAHGKPLRALFPGVYGQKQPKWINSIRVDKSDKLGTWEDRGWSNDAVIQTNSKIETPRSRQNIPSGSPFYITGWAMADSSGIQQVEISTDGGQTWRPAETLPGPDHNVWTLWYWVWEDPPVGTHVLMARAANGGGQVQASGSVPGLLNNVFPNGSSLMHRLPVNVVSA